MPVTLKSRIEEDMKAAQRARDPARLTAIRLLLAAVKQKEIDERIVADDAVVLGIVERLIKQRNDSIDQFRTAGRDDLVAKETAELELLQGYLPTQLADEELLRLIDEAIAATGASGAQAMGKVMAALKPKLAGRAEMARVSAAVKQRLAK